MRGLVDGRTNNMLFEEVFLHQIPDDIRLKLAQQDFLDLNAVAERADALLDAKNKNINTVGINRLPTKKRYTEATNATKDSQSPAWSFFYSKFGTKAKKCRKPCSFTIDSTATSQITAISHSYLRKTFV
ncbi:hypothetical protein HZS_1846 [Henneguya salminicola]|nr:hypothetical protein HZS_1846 [Henneguya salminicola]